MISPCWAASFASPTAAVSLSALATSASGGDNSVLEPKKAVLKSLSSVQWRLAAPNRSLHSFRGKEVAKAAVMAVAREVARNAKSGSGKASSSVAMSASLQRRNASDMERARRWTVNEAMGVAWAECLHAVDTESIYEKDLSNVSRKYIAILVASLALARKLQRSEVCMIT